MMRLILCSTVLLLASAVGSYAQAKSLKDVKTASCANSIGAFIEIDVPASGIKGKFGTLKALSNYDLESREVFGFREKYPTPDYTSLGGLASDETGYWGHLAILAETSKVLGEQESLDAFFTDMNGQAQLETVDCALTFN